MWTETTREKYRRDELRYASDTRPGEWAQIAPLFPARRRLGRPRERDLRTIVDAILYLLWTGCQWRALPHGFPPRSTVQGYFYRRRDDGTWQRINARLVARARQKEGRKLTPGAGRGIAVAARFLPASQVLSRPGQPLGSPCAGRPWIWTWPPPASSRIRKARNSISESAQRTHRRAAPAVSAAANSSRCGGPA